MKNTIKFLLLGYIIFLCCKLTSCSDMDDYLKYLDDGIPTYTGIVDSVNFHSGDGRVVFKGLLTSDPKIKKVKIYWGNRKDSLILDINRTSGVDTLFQPIPLPEGRYNFEVISFDDKDIPSIIVTKTGISYGAEYKAGLYNRPIKNLEKIGDNVVIDWYNGDETSPFVRLDYIDKDGKVNIVKVPTVEMQTTLENFKDLTKIGMQAYYLPDETAIDTFKAVHEQFAVEDITSVYIKNSGNPFLRDQSVEQKGKWGVLADWSYNAALLNQEGGTLGGWSDEDYDSDGIKGGIHFESASWNQGPLENGKIWQSANIQKGKYEFTFRLARAGGNWNTYFVVMKGNGEIPNVDNVENNPEILAYVKIPNNDAREYQIPFELDTAQDITYGWVASSENECYLRIKWIKLRIKPELK